MFSIILQNIQKATGYTAWEGTQAKLNGDDSGQW